MSEDRRNSVFYQNIGRWPQAGDRLFVPGRDTFLAERADERNFRLLRGYKRAGDVLVKAALENRVDCANLVYPAIFNYRHYIELALKGIIEEHGPTICKKSANAHHKLPALWSAFLEISSTFGNDCWDDAVVAVGLCIDEFARLDGGSTAFRYARTRKGDTMALPNNGLDLIRLHDVMNGLENFFECADMDFSHKSDLGIER